MNLTDESDHEDVADRAATFGFSQIIFTRQLLSTIRSILTQTLFFIRRMNASVIILVMIVVTTMMMTMM